MLTPVLIQQGNPTSGICPRDFSLSPQEMQMRVMIAVYGGLWQQRVGSNLDVYH